MNSIKSTLSGLTQSLKGEHLSGSASVSAAAGYEAGEKLRKFGDMGGRAVCQLKDGASSVLNALRQALQSKSSATETSQPDAAKQRSADELNNTFRELGF